MENVGIFWFISRLLGKSYGRLVYSMVIWYIFPLFNMLDPGKSSNPADGEMLYFGKGFFNIPTRVAHIFSLILQKMGWATFWAVF
jgi:hypothetical protein